MRNSVKIISLLLAVIILSFVIPIYADTVIDYVLFTDIRTYISGVEISSYNIKGNTAVVVEDLADYGFDVTWNGDSRTLSVSRNTSKSIIGGEISTVSGGKVGDKAMPVYATDIRTYLDGNYTESYNVGGRTIVYVDDLAKFYSASDGYAWNGTDKTLSLRLSEGINKIINIVPEAGYVEAPSDPVRISPIDPGYNYPTGKYSTEGLNVVSPYDYYTFVLNIDSGKFHKANYSCSAKAKLSDENAVYVNNTYEEVVAAGFEPCGICWR